MRSSAVCVFVPALALALSILDVPAAGEEVIVKNDSIVDYGQAYIVGNFVPGEVAAARLTSPCAGTIVGLQILWLEGTPGHPPSLEAGIHIWQGATFPAPGTELAFLEGPVLTPGYWNEFRHLDEAGQIPINVPVTNGQQFYIGLEFANPTDVGNGGPSVVRDVNGCQSGKNSLYAIPGGWLNFCIYITGDLAIRAIVDCPGVTGACCHLDGTCENNIEQPDCAAFGDVWTEGQTCAQVTCTPRGACCRAGGCLQKVTQQNCESIGGVYAGDGTNCDTQVCVAGACCIAATGECILNFEFQCAALGGTFLGHGTTCSPNPCPQPTGACCFGQFCIEDQTQADCTGTGGVWAGAQSTCADDDGNGIGDVCEGCTGDLNCDGQVDFGDINPFVKYVSNCTSWQTAYPDCPPENGDIDGDGQHACSGAPFDDINAFVGLLSSAPLPIMCD